MSKMSLRNSNSRSILHQLSLDNLLVPGPGAYEQKEGTIDERIKTNFLKHIENQELLRDHSLKLLH